MNDDDHVGCMYSIVIMFAVLLILGAIVAIASKN